MAATKCNIVKQVYEKITSEIWGLSCVDNSVHTVKNYIQYLDCPNAKIESCGEKECTSAGSTGGFKNCILEVKKIEFSYDEETGEHTFFVKQEDVVGNNPPYSFFWVFDENVFDLVSEGDSDEFWWSHIVLKLKEGISLEGLTTAISVVAKDEIGCTDVQTCWWVNGEDMECGAVYLPCPNTTGLVVVPGNYIPCPASTNLVVTPFTEEEEDECDDDSIITETENCIIAENEFFIVTE